MRQRLSAIGRRARKVHRWWLQTEPYITVFGSLGAVLMTGAWAWVVSTIQSINALGWGIWLVLGLLLTLLSLAAMSLAVWLADRFRRQRTMVRSDDESRVRSEPALAENDEISESKALPAGYDDLLAFFLSYLEPMVNAHRALYEGIITAGVPNDIIRNLALGRISDEDPLYSSFSFAAAKMAGSPAERPSFYELTTAIHNSEFTYQDAIAKRDAIAHSLGLEIKSDPQLFELWEDWRVKHNALVVEYETIKRDQRFGRLFRPIRESKWGGSIPPPTPQAEPTGNRSRRGTSRT